MSDDTEETQTSSNAPELPDVYENFKKEIGHYPHSVQQFFAYVKQKNHPYKFVDCNKFWPQRPNPAAKPQGKPINSDDYKDVNDKDKQQNEEQNKNDATDANKDNNAANNDNTGNSGDADADADANANEDENQNEDE